MRHGNRYIDCSNPNNLERRASSHARWHMSGYLLIWPDVLLAVFTCTYIKSLPAAALHVPMELSYDLILYSSYVVSI